MQLRIQVFKQLAFMFVLLLMIANETIAGVHSNADGQQLFETARIEQFSQRVEQTLADTGARVAIIARTGRPEGELPAGVRYTHVAFAVYSNIETNDGSHRRGYAIYNLYQKPEQPDESFLLQDYPYQFFAPVSVLRSGIIIPVPELQKRLLQTITSDHYASLHNPKYSVISNPYNNEVQNCTEFTLNILNAAIYQTDDMQYLKTATRDHFDATRLNISPLKLLAASALMNDFRTSDHPEQIQTATYGSIKDYLQKHGLVKQVIHLNESL